MNQYSLLPVDEMPFLFGKVAENYKPKQDFSNPYINLKWVLKITSLHKPNISSLALNKRQF